MNKEENRQLFLNIKESFNNTEGIYDVEPQLDDKNYSVACNICNGDRLAFGIRKTEGIAFIKSSVKTTGFTDSKIIEICDTVLSGISTITYNININKVIFQAMIPAKCKTFDENNDLVFREVKQFIEVMTKCCKMLGTGDIIELNKKEYIKQKKELNDMPRTDDTLMDMDSFAEDIQPVDLMDEEIETNEERTPFEDVSDGDDLSDSSAEFTGIVSDDGEDEEEEKEEYTSETTKPVIEEPIIQQEKPAKPINSQTTINETSSISTSYQNSVDNRRDNHKNQDLKTQSQKTDNRNNRDNKESRNMNSDNRNISKVDNIFSNYDRDLKNIENKYRNQIRNMSIDELLKLIEGRYSKYYDSENKSEISDYIKEKICESAKSELKFRISKR